MLWQASNASIQSVIRMAPHRRVPTNEEPSNLDCPFSCNAENKVSLAVEGSAAWIHMAGPIGVYYVHALDVHPVYKSAFCDLLWCVHKLRRRFVTRDTLDPTSNKRTYVRWIRDALARLEWLMPVHFCTFTLHLMQHACEALLYTGPPHGTWMFPFERWIQIAKRILKSSKSALVGLMKATVENEWSTYHSYQTMEHLKALETPPLSHSNARHIRLLGNGIDVDLDSKIVNTKLKSDWNLVFQFLLREDPLYVIIADEYERSHRHEATPNNIEIWQISFQSISSIIQKVRDKLQKEVSAEELRQLLKGPPKRAVEYKRMEVNGVVFVTSRYESAKGRRSRRFCFYVNSHQQTLFNDFTVNKDTIEYPIGAIERILQIKNTDSLRLQTCYTVLRIRNYKYLPKHVSKLPYVEPLSIAATVATQPIIDAASIKPYNVALWPATADRVTNRFLAVWIDPQHGDT